MSTALWLLIVAVSMIVAFIVGIYAEREEWNDLIDKGVLPKPRNTK